MKMSVQSSPEPPTRSLGQELMNSLTPSQYAEMFPGHYKKGGTKVASLGTSALAVPPPEGTTTNQNQGITPSSPGQRRSRGERTPNIASLRNTEPKPKAWHEKLAKFDDPASTDAPLYAKDRQRFSDETKNDDTMKKLYNLAHTEVGSDPKEQQKWAETVFNRAQFSGRSIDSIINDKGYYPKHTANQVSAETLENFRNSVVSPVMAGSNITKSATDNASNDYKNNNQVANKRIAAGATGSWSKGALDKGEYHYYGGERAGRYKTSHGVAAEQNQKRIEEAARLAAAEKEKQGPKVAVPPLPEGMNESVMKHFNGLPDEAAKERFRKQVHRAIESGEFTVDSLNKEAEARIQQTTVSSAPNDKTRSLLEQYPEGTTRFFREGGKTEGLNPKLIDVLHEASKDLPPGYHIRMFSGKDARATGTQNHPGGVAVDLAIYDSNGKRLADRGFGDGHKVYEQLAQSMNIRGKEKYPGTEYVWGGAWTVAGGDRMHYQIKDPDQPVPGASRTSGQYTFENGVDPNLWAGRQAAQQFMSPKELAEYRAKTKTRVAEERELLKKNPVAAKPPGPPQVALIAPEPAAPAAPTGPKPFFAGRTPSPATPSAPTPQAAPAAPTPTPATPTPATPTPATPAPTPAVTAPKAEPVVEPKKEEPPVPKMKTGGEAQAQSEDLAVVNSATGKPQLMFNSSEKLEVDKGRIKVTADHRNEPATMEPQQPRPESRQWDRETQPIQQMPQQAQAPAMERTNIHEYVHIPQTYHSPSFKRAMDQAVGFREEGNHYNNFISTQKKA